jgi:hypothetical protein
MVKVTLTFRETIKLKVKITVEVTDFYGNGELRLFAAMTNTRTFKTFISQNGKSKYKNGYPCYIQLESC